jgi:hypothetical protein
LINQATKKSTFNSEQLQSLIEAEHLGETETQTEALFKFLQQSLVA